MSERYMHHYESEQWLPVSNSTAWEFFSSPLNLARITPPDLRFRIRTEGLSGKIHDGMIIDYTLTPLSGFRVRWKTEIINVVSGKQFTDRQLKGPYVLWEHTHTFTAENNGTLMKDSVKYRLPFGIAGNIVHSLLIRKRIEDIFNYRRGRLSELFI